MSKRTDIKICRYPNCKHLDKIIDITQDSYIAEGRMYYHSDCYDFKKKGDWKDEKTKKDLQYIKNQWALYINKTVVYSQLLYCLNELIARGIPSEYLVFVFDYIIKHKMNLRYPQGFKYYVDKKEIKDAYQKYLISKNNTKNNFNYVVTEDCAEVPKLSIKQKPRGFGSIIKNKGD